MTLKRYWYSTRIVKKIFLKANPEKYNLLLSTDKNNALKVEEFAITNGKCEKLLGIKADSQLCFENHVKSLYKKASQKFNALLQVVWSLTFPQRKLLLNAFIISQFPYVPIVCMFHSRKMNHRVNDINERTLRLVYKDYNSSFNDILVKDSSFRIHQSSLQKLTVEIFEVKVEHCSRRHPQKL